MSRQVLLLVFVVIAGGPAYGQQLSGAAHEESAPGSIAEPIRALLGPGGVRVTPGNLTLDFWWVTSLPVKAGGEVTWLGVAEGTVVGAVRLSGEYRDVRGKAIRPGVYTLRYGIQPANGDHLGVLLALISVKTFSHDLPVANQHRTHHGIGRCQCCALLC